MWKSDEVELGIILGFIILGNDGEEAFVTDNLDEDPNRKLFLSPCEDYFGEIKPCI